MRKIVKHRLFWPIVALLALVAVNTRESFVKPSGVLAQVDLASKKIDATCDLGGQPAHDRRGRRRIGLRLLLGERVPCLDIQLRRLREGLQRLGAPHRR